MSNRAAEEAEIRRSFGDLTQALRAKDVDTLMAHYAPDTIVFDLRPPQRIATADAYRRNFEAWFGSTHGPIGYEVHELTVTVGNDVAFCHSLSHVQCQRTSGEEADYWVRVTSGLRKVSGRWLIAHEHVSMPIDLQTMAAGPNLQS